MTDNAERLKEIELKMEEKYSVNYMGNNEIVKPKPSWKGFKQDVRWLLDYCKELQAELTMDTSYETLKAYEEKVSQLQAKLDAWENKQHSGPCDSQGICEKCTILENDHFINVFKENKALKADNERLQTENEKFKKLLHERHERHVIAREELLKIFPIFKCSKKGTKYAVALVEAAKMVEQENETLKRLIEEAIPLVDCHSKVDGPDNLDEECLKWLERARKEVGE